MLLQPTSAEIETRTARPAAVSCEATTAAAVAAAVAVAATACDCAPVSGQEQDLDTITRSC